MTDYERIEKAIDYINQHFREQPNLDEVAKQVYLSPFHFQRLFKEWAGVTPKKFLQYISLEHAKQLLQQKHSLAHVSFEAGLSGTSRLHDLFISIEGMTPGEYKNDGENLEIHYSFAETFFGDVLIASTDKGICHISFAKNQEEELAAFRNRFVKALIIQKTDLHQQSALQVFKNDWKDLGKIKLHLKATPFQVKVWEALLKIPFASVSTYSGIAQKIESPKASRAVGTAIANNPVAFLIPCHRVIRSTGLIGEYHWGSTRKKAIIGWEAAQTCLPDRQVNAEN
jgi:AraC family transcriptional regulator, regulatory protein of adaptative response / methylated-DNA-[protein]-cysteine methyltransferase